MSDSKKMSVLGTVVKIGVGLGVLAGLGYGGRRLWMARQQKMAAIKQGATTVKLQPAITTYAPGPKNVGLKDERFPADTTTKVPAVTSGSKPITSMPQLDPFTKNQVNQVGRRFVDVEKSKQKLAINSAKSALEIAKAPTVQNIQKGAAQFKKDALSFGAAGNAFYGGGAAQSVDLADQVTSGMLAKTQLFFH